jgi:hypothetical protein
MSLGTGRQNIIILFWKEQFQLWEPDIYIGFSPSLHLQCRVGWMSLESRLKLVCRLKCWVFVCGRSKSLGDLPNFPPAGLEPMFSTSVALTAQYLNVGQHKLATTIIMTVRILQQDTVVLSQTHGPMRKFAWVFKFYFNITYPDNVPFHLCPMIEAHKEAYGVATSVRA